VTAGTVTAEKTHCSSVCIAPLGRRLQKVGAETKLPFQANLSDQFATLGGVTYCVRWNNAAGSVRRGRDGLIHHAAARILPWRKASPPSGYIRIKERLERCRVYHAVAM
jgi:hypothetical protein